jgi:hypothetical protein
MCGADVNRHWRGRDVILASYWTRVGEVRLYATLAYLASVWSRCQQTLAREGCNIGFLLDEGRGSKLVCDLSLFSVCVEQTLTDTGEGGM